MKLSPSDILAKAAKSKALATKLAAAAEAALQDVEAIQDNASYDAEKKIRLVADARKKHTEAMVPLWREATTIGEELKAEKQFHENLAFLASQAEFGSGKSGDASLRNQLFQELLHLPAPLVKLHLDAAIAKNDIATGYQIYRVSLQRARQEDFKEVFTRVSILEKFKYEGRDEVLQAVAVAQAHAAAALSSYRIAAGTQKAVSVQKLQDARAMREAENIFPTPARETPQPLPGTKPIPADAE
ncbi:MAG: hypothetical protein KGJ49_12995 [Alphaproteobacteria bacterium]|nr:hypothetical protein [Alphaproteobacteria bacterium]